MDRQGSSTVLEMLAYLSAGAIGPYEYWLDTWLAESRRMARVATAWSNETLEAQRVMAATVADAIVETEMALTAAAPQNPVTLLARLGETVRTTAFACAEAGVMAQERLARIIRDEGVCPAVGPAWLSRAVVLATVAADLLTAYTALEERARWWSDPVTPAERAALHRRGAALVLQTITSLGGILIKAAQFASARPDLLPSPYITAFAGLQDRVPPRPWPVITDALTRALGCPLEEVFTTIDPQPLAAASLAQVHRARLHDGRVVAVKVQYPDIAELATTDLEALQVMVHLLAQSTASPASLPPTSTCWRSSRTTLRCPAKPRVLAPAHDHLVRLPLGPQQQARLVPVHAEQVRHQTRAQRERGRACTCTHCARRAASCPNGRYRGGEDGLPPTWAIRPAGLGARAGHHDLRRPGRLRQGRRDRCRQRPSPARPCPRRRCEPRRHG